MIGPKVSLVTPSYNMEPYLERTIRSVLCQEYPNIEYIVLDSCSKDGTREILDKYASAIDVLIVEKDKGQSDALNRGLGLATGEILGYLNADDCLASPRTIADVVRKFQERPNADVLSGHRYFIDKYGDFALRYPTRPASDHILRRACYIAQEATFWRRGLYEKVGGYIDVSFDFAMDYELWMRFLAAGARIEVVPEVWGLFRWYPDQKSRAIWETKGLPEIGRLHEKYLGKRLTEEEMFNYHREYLYGAHPTEYPDAYRFYKDFWGDMVYLGRMRMHGKPLDAWVNRVPINRERTARLAWERGRKTVADSLPARAASRAPEADGFQGSLASRAPLVSLGTGRRGKPSRAVQACPACGVEDAATADDSRTRSLHICRACRHLFWDRCPPHKLLANFYKSEYCIGDDQPKRQNLLRDYYRQHAQDLPPHIGRPRERVFLVDYGSSIPVLVEEAKAAGLGRALAVEYAEPAHAYAKERGLECLTPEEFAITVRSASVDILRFSGVLQHLANPAAVLTTALRKLNPGGLLHITQPSYPVFKAEALKKDLPGTVYPTHLQFFSPLSLLTLLSRFPLRITCLFTHTNAETRYYEYRDYIDLYYATQKLGAVKERGESSRGPEGNYPFYAGEYLDLYAIKQGCA